MRDGEQNVQGIQHLPRMYWNEWMAVLSTFKYAVHMMPTVAAGTFALNCAYFGIPCIGNVNVDTQLLCHPSLSVEVNDLQSARDLAILLKEDVDFYNECSTMAKQRYHEIFTKELWLERIKEEL
jgi:hypothetical protein